MKLQPFTPEQRDFVRMVGMGVAEARLYASVGNDLPVRMPHVWHASFDEGDGSFVMVLEDLEASGCRFTSAEDDDILDTAGALMDELATLHATYWKQDLPWLKGPAGFRNNKDGAKVAGQAAAIMQSALDQFADDMPPAFRQLGELYIDSFADINALYREGDRTLVHGDDHIGNLFVDGTGRLGFYDWAIASMLPGIRDVAYFLANSLPTELRRAEEGGLVARYRAGLAERGVTLDEATAPRPVPAVRRVLVDRLHDDRRDGRPLAAVRDRPRRHGPHHRGDHRPRRRRPPHRTTRLRLNPARRINSISRRPRLHRGHDRLELEVLVESFLAELAPDAARPCSRRTERRSPSCTG